ncbi:FUSC family protein [Pelomonas sp. KK5]|uniref:FUSC family protein n=1 Tax=Pelomonas sp. KK5 TaxID=1855730 RepID=UPI00097C9D33|nr:FUSC family protein [Pelomonas sp. KK5]
MNGRAPLASALREAVATMLAALGTLGCTLAIAPSSGAAVLGVLLCLSLSRSRLDRSLRGRLEAAAVLPLVALAAAAVGWLLLHWRWLGAGAFVLTMGASIWLRRFGPAGLKAGMLIALPFVAILVTPVDAAMPAWLPAVIGLLALAWVSAVHALAQRTGWLVPAPSPAAPAVASPGTLRPRASTRQALQMAAALALSFVIGYLVFPERWAWVVLTAFIVNSGNQGRLDVVYKAALRLLGAAAGTVLALLVARIPVDAAPAWMLAALFMAVWLRPLGYGWWALFLTLALALLQPGGIDLGLRLEEIAVGALTGIAAAWWLLPLRTSDVLRRRIADALTALAGALDPSDPTRSPERFIAALDAIQTLAPPLRALRRIRPMQEADWIDELAAARAPLLTLIESRATPPALRRQVGAARQALREPQSLLAALQALRRLTQS